MDPADFFEAWWLGTVKFTWFVIRYGGCVALGYYLAIH